MLIFSNVRRKKAEPHELILDHLRVIRTDVAGIKADVREIRKDILTLKNDVNGLRSDILRLEENEAETMVHIERINTRLGLIDPTN